LPATNVTIAPSSAVLIIVPPKPITRTYSLATGGVVSITSLFLAEFSQGCCWLSLMLLCLFYAHRDKHLKGELVPQIRRMLGEAFVGIVGLGDRARGILIGVFTLIEAGAGLASGRFFFRHSCSSTATINGRNCHSWLYRTPRADAYDEFDVGRNCVLFRLHHRSLDANAREDDRFFVVAISSNKIRTR
jgi:hypothetical protein